MPQSNFIPILLGIKDPNINLIKPFVTEEKLKLGGDFVIHKVIHAKLDKKHFFRLLELDIKGLGSDVKTAIKTLRDYSDYLENSMDYRFSNGPLEGTIRKIKLLSRVSYGFRSFERFKNRFFIINNLVKMKVDQPLTPLGLEAAYK